MRILLIMPRLVESLGQKHDFPLGIAYISAALKEAQFDVVCVNLNLIDCDLNALLGDYIRRQGIGIVCTGGGATEYRQIKSIVSSVKALDSKVITIVGGALFSCEPDLMLRNVPIDFGIIGEGELTVVELVRAIVSKTDPSGVPGIAYLDQQGRTVRTAPREVVAELDSLPFPDFEGFGAAFQLSLQKPFDNLFGSDDPRHLPMISSRSCPFSCTFCYHPLGNKYRLRSLDNFFEELSALVDKYDLNAVIVYDDLFCTDRQRVLEFCSRIKPYHLHWLPQMRVNDVDDSVLDALKDSGCLFIGYGVESADDTILESMNKKITLAQIESALSLTVKHKIGIRGNLILGDPAETEETAQRTLQWWLDHREFNLNLGFISPFPGSRIYLDSVRTGRISDRLKYIEDGCPAINMSKMTNEAFDRLCKKVIRLKGLKNCADLVKTAIATREGCRGPLFELILRCPHCHDANTYRNVSSCAEADSCDPRLACRSCHQRFDVPPEAFEIL